MGGWGRGEARANPRLGEGKFMIEEDHGSNGGDVRLDFIVNQIVDFLHQVPQC